MQIKAIIVIIIWISSSLQTLEDAVESLRGRRWQHTRATTTTIALLLSQRSKSCAEILETRLHAVPSQREQRGWRCVCGNSLQGGIAWSCMQVNQSRRLGRWGGQHFTTLRHLLPSSLFGVLRPQIGILWSKGVPAWHPSLWAGYLITGSNNTKRWWHTCWTANPWTVLDQFCRQRFLQGKTHIFTSVGSS